jgi:hypothetical protein
MVLWSGRSWCFAKPDTILYRRPVLYIGLKFIESQFALNICHSFATIWIKWSRRSVDNAIEGIMFLWVASRLLEHSDFTNCSNYRKPNLLIWGIWCIQLNLLWYRILLEDLLHFWNLLTYTVYIIPAVLDYVLQAVTASYLGNIKMFRSPHCIKDDSFTVIVC